MGEKQPVAINFVQGLNTKTDPWQLPPGQFLALENSVFSTLGQLKKRNGYGLVTTFSDASTISTFSGNLVGIGNVLNLYSEDTQKNINTGYIQPLSLSVLPMVRRASGQTTVDTAIAPNGLCCSAWLDSDANSYYQVSDSTTGSAIVPAVALTTGTDVAATMPRVFVLGNYFVITYLATVSATPTLRYVALPLANPGVPMAATTISSQVSSIAGAYDGIVANIGPDLLYLAWNGSDGGGAIRIVTLNSSLVHGTAVTIASTSAQLISTAWDYTNSQLWLSLYNSSSNTIKCTAYNQALTVVVRAPVTTVSSITLSNGLTSTASGGVVTVFYEVTNNYGYDSSVRADYISKNTCNLAGTAGSPSVVLRGVGLGSKAVILGDLDYMLAVFGSAYQPSYFLIDSSGNVIGKLAYSNGGGYVINQILPQLILSENSEGQSVLRSGYLFKDFLASIANPIGPVGLDTGTNKTMGATSTLPIYTQTGINLATFTFGTDIPTAETGGILHMGAGFPWMFDGVKPVEHQFHVWPDNVELTSVAASGGGLSAQQYYYQAIYYWTDAAGNPQYSAPSVPVTTTIAAGTGVTFTSTFSSGATSIVASSASNLFVGQVLTDNTTGANITAGTYITSIVGTTLGLSKPTAGNSGGGGDTLKTVDQGTVTVNVPTLRQTYKTSNKISIRIYRWSTANQNFYEITSVSSPTLNDPTADSISFVDHKNDLAIVGNSLMYTTGGVVEDIAGPASSIFCQFDDRLWLVDAENPNLLWYSKQVIAGTGVEFSDLFTLYVAPNQGAQGSTGPITAICPMDVELVIFKRDAIYYINGTGPDNAGNNNQYSQPVIITATVGCTNPNSIVFTDNGLMFQSDKGIWLLGRNLQTQYIGAPVEGLVLGNTVTSAQVIPETTQVRFTMDTGITLMYDYFYGQWGTFTNTSAISSTLYQGLHTYLNEFGQALQETPGEYLDITSPVLMSFTTSWLNLAALQGFERFYSFYFVGQYLSPHKMQVLLAYNYVDSAAQSVTISPKNFSAAAPSPFGEQPAPFGSPINLEQFRIFPRQQKCQAFQITMNELYDPSFGVIAGAGLTLSGLNLLVAVKRGSRPIPAKYTAG